MAESNGGARDGLIGRDAEFGVLARIAAAVRLFVDASLAYEAEAMIDRVGPLTKPRSAAWADWARAMAAMTQGRFVRRGGSAAPGWRARPTTPRSLSAHASTTDFFSQIGRFADSLLQFIGGVVASTPGSATVAVTLAGGRFMAGGPPRRVPHRGRPVSDHAGRDRRSRADSNDLGGRRGRCLRPYGQP